MKIESYGTRKNIDNPVPTVNSLTVNSRNFGTMEAEALGQAGRQLERTSNQGMNIFTQMADKKAVADAQMAHNNMQEASIAFDNELLAAPLETQTNAIEATKKFYDEQKLLGGESLTTNNARSRFNASFERSRLSAMQAATRLQISSTEKFYVQGLEVSNANIMNRQALQPIYDPEETARNEERGMANVRAVNKNARSDYRDMKAEEWRDIYYKGGFDTLVKQGRGQDIWKYFNDYKDKFLPSELPNLRLQAANCYSDYKEKQVMIHANQYKNNPNLLNEMKVEVDADEKEAKELTDEYIQLSLKEAENPEYDASDPLRGITKRGLSRLSTGIEFMVNQVKIEAAQSIIDGNVWSTAENIKLLDNGTINKTTYDYINKINSGKAIKEDKDKAMELEQEIFSMPPAGTPKERMKQTEDFLAKLTLINVEDKKQYSKWIKNKFLHAVDESPTSGNKKTSTKEDNFINARNIFSKATGRDGLNLDYKQQAVFNDAYKKGLATLPVDKDGLQDPIEQARIAETLSQHVSWTPDNKLIYRYQIGQAKINDQEEDEILGKSLPVILAEKSKQGTEIGYYENKNEYYYYEDGKYIITDTNGTTIRTSTPKMMEKEGVITPNRNNAMINWINPDVKNAIETDKIRTDSSGLKRPVILVEEIQPLYGNPKIMVYPHIRKINGELKYLSMDEAKRYARINNDMIMFDSTKKFDSWQDRFMGAINKNGSKYKSEKGTFAEELKKQDEARADYRRERDKERQSRKSKWEEKWKTR